MMPATGGGVCRLAWTMASNWSRPATPPGEGLIDPPAGNDQAALLAVTLDCLAPGGDSLILAGAVAQVYPDEISGLQGVPQAGVAQDVRLTAGHLWVSCRAAAWPLPHQQTHEAIHSFSQVDQAMSQSTAF